MNQQDNINFVVSELAKYRNRNDVIRDLCERSGCRWEEAAAIVRRVESEQDHAIQVRRRPILTLLGAVFCLSGLALMVLGVYLVLSGEVLPLTVELGFVEIDLPNGGQIVFIVAGLPILLGGIVGTRRAYRDVDSSEGKQLDEVSHLHRA